MYHRYPIPRYITINPNNLKTAPLEEKKTPDLNKDIPVIIF